MTYLLDTNILLRWTQADHPFHALAVSVVDELYDRNDRLHITPQNVVEFWSVATRPPEVNGLGLSPIQADEAARRIEALFPLLPDGPDVHSAWRQLVLAIGVRGRQVHDARLVAVMGTHGITHLLTLNPDDFRRYPGITPSTRRTSARKTTLLQWESDSHGVRYFPCTRIAATAAWPMPMMIWA